MHGRFHQSGRRFAWGAVGTFAFVLLTFWGINLLSPAHRFSIATHAICSSSDSAIIPRPSPCGSGLPSPTRRFPTPCNSCAQTGIATEAVILSTCNRVEIYAATPWPERQAMQALRQFLLDHHNYREPIGDEIYSHGEAESLEHLFKVACGLDSMVLGETEILGQLKKAYDTALQHKHTGGHLNKAFQKAFNVAKQIRTETNIQRGSVSVGSVAVELAEKIFSSLRPAPGHGHRRGRNQRKNRARAAQPRRPQHHCLQPLP